MAGTIAATNNKLELLGIASQSDVYALKALNENGSGNLSPII
ncbi:hypothetical protein KHA80_05490 [Anaerobacillus sp. HL2]|nr:hypothetical protein KHA80_05490 [Anaerobacillus sp. HL2]